MARNKSSTGKVSTADRMGRRVCPHCLHRVRFKKGTRRFKRGGLHALPNPNGSQPIRAYRHIPLYAWLEPGEDRALLHVLIRGPHGGTHYISLWLEDLGTILATKTDKAVTFTLSPDVRLLEVQGKEILRNAFPPSWLNALERGYVKPSQDLTKKYGSILEKL